MNFFNRNIEGCHDSSSFRSGNNDVLIFVKKCGPDAIGIAHHKAVTITNETAKNETAVEMSCSLF